MSPEERRLVFGVAAWTIRSILMLAANVQWKGAISLGEIGALRRKGEDLLRDINGHY